MHPPFRFRPAAVVFTVAVGLAVLSACTARGKPSSLETKLANAAKDVVIPLEAERAANPVADTPLAVAQGQAVFQAHCALCHSSDGHSQNTLGLAMFPPAMDLTSPHVQAWKDSEMFWIINNGIRLTGMPAWQGQIAPTDAWKLVLYVRALPQMTATESATLAALVEPPPPPVPVARTPDELHQAAIAYGSRLVLQEGCLKCHSLGKSGAGFAPNLAGEGKRGRSNAWLAGHFKDPAAFVPDSEMPAFDHLTSGQVQALIAFLQHQQD